MGIAGRICEALRRRPMAMPRRLSEPVKAASTTPANAVTRSIYGDRSVTASGPSHAIITIKLINKRATGMADNFHEGTFSESGKQSKIFFNAIFFLKPDAKILKKHGKYIISSPDLRFLIHY